MGFPRTRKNLLEHLADGKFHSGTELSECLSVSRTGIWKQLHVLEDLGLEIDAVAGKGYRLTHPLELLDQDRIVDNLDEAVRRLISGVEIHDRIDSTNTRLVSGIQTGMSAGSVCLAECQSAGRGRRGRAWVSPFGRNIYLSLLWRFQKGPAALAGLSLAAGVCVARALVSAKIPGVGLKWPNDICWDGRKLGGILVEVQGESNGPCAAVIGLGLNFYLPAASAVGIDQEWVDLSQITGHDLPSRNQMVSAILNEMVPMVARYEEGGLTPYLSAWRGFDCVSGKRAALHFGETVIAGVVQGISDDGLLILREDDGEEKRYASGEVSFSS